MQTAVIARAILSVSLSVHLSVTFKCFVQTNEDTIVRSIVLVSEAVVYPDIPMHPSEGLKLRHPLSLVKI